MHASRMTSLVFAVLTVSVYARPLFFPSSTPTSHQAHLERTNADRLKHNLGPLPPASFEKRHQRWLPSKTTREPRRPAPSGVYQDQTQNQPWSRRGAGKGTIEVQCDDDTTGQFQEVDENGAFRIIDDRDNAIQFQPDVDFTQLQPDNRGFYGPFAMAHNDAAAKAAGNPYMGAYLPASQGNGAGSCIPMPYTQPLAKPQVIDETQYASSIWYMNPKTGEVESRWTKSESTEVQTYVGIDRNTSEAVFWDQEQEKTCTMTFRSSSGSPAYGMDDPALPGLGAPYHTGRV